MTREQVQNLLAEITAVIPKQYSGKVEGLAWELFHFADDASKSRDEAIAANRALEELMVEKQQQLASYKLKIKQLEANLEKAKNETQIMRNKLDEWCRALDRGKESTQIVKGLDGVHESKERSAPAQ